MGEYSVPLEKMASWAYEYNLTESNYSYNDYLCPDTEASPTHRLQKVLVPVVHLLIFLLGGLGNLLVMIILWHYRHSRTSTELFLFHFALANFLLLLTFPFGVAESLAGWVFGTFLCKVLSATNRMNFYSSSLLLSCISVDRYLAVVWALQTFQKQRGLSVHLSCLGIWFVSFLLTMPDLLFTEVWAHSANLSICYFKEHGTHGINSWLAKRFLYHLVGFFLPLGVMCYCYTAIVRFLCQSQRRQRQKAVRVAIVVTCVFLLCWTPHNIVVFWDTLAKLELTGKRCTVEEGLSSAIVVTEMLAYSHCCLNPILYAFVGIRFRHDLCQVLQNLGCLSQSARQKVLGTCRAESSTETNVSVLRPPASLCSAKAASPGLPDPLLLTEIQLAERLQGEASDQI